MEFEESFTVPMECIFPEVPYMKIGDILEIRYNDDKPFKAEITDIEKTDKGIRYTFGRVNKCRRNGLAKTVNKC